MFGNMLDASCNKCLKPYSFKLSIDKSYELQKSVKHILILHKLSHLCTNFVLVLFLSTAICDFFIFLTYKRKQGYCQNLFQFASSVDQTPTPN